MTGLTKTFGAKINQSCLVTTQLRKDGCKVVMSAMPTCRLVVDFDKPGSPICRNATRCDYLVVARETDRIEWIMALELKSGPLNASKVIVQLEAGAKAAQKLVSSHEASNVIFRPIVFCRGSHRHERNKLSKSSNRIRFHGCWEPIRMMKCGEAHRTIP